MSDAPVWLTYRAAAERLGVSAPAVAARARRNRWAKRTRNDTGEAEIAVPAALLVSPPETPRPAPPGASQADPPPTPPTVGPDALAAIVGPLTSLLERERADRVTLQSQADALRDQLHAARLDAATATGEAALERQRREAVETRAADLERQLADARDALARRRRWWPWRA